MATESVVLAVMSSMARHRSINYSSVQAVVVPGRFGKLALAAIHLPLAQLVIMVHRVVLVAASSSLLQIPLVSREQYQRLAWMSRPLLRHCWVEQVLVEAFALKVTQSRWEQFQRREVLLPLQLAMVDLVVRPFTIKQVTPPLQQIHHRIWLTQAQ